MRYFIFCLLLISIAACQPAPTAPAPASSAPMLTVREATNCRTGPGTNYDIVFTYQTGAKLEIAGHDESGDFWLVKSAESPTGTCWMWGEFVDATGNYGAVSNATPPPTPTGASGSVSGGTPPGAPSLQKWDYTCDSGTMTFTVIWRDRAADETGYRVFRNGEAIAELPANSTTYTDTLSESPGMEYYIQVYGPGGSANSSVMKADC